MLQTQLFICPPLNPPPNYFFNNLSYLRKWRLHYFSCLVQISWDHPWLLSFLQDLVSHSLMNHISLPLKHSLSSNSPTTFWVSAAIMFLPTFLKIIFQWFSLLSSFSLKYFLSRMGGGIGREREIICSDLSDCISQNSTSASHFTGNGNWSPADGLQRPTCSAYLLYLTSASFYFHHSWALTVSWIF